MTGPSLQAANAQWREGLTALGFSDDGQQLRGLVEWSAPNGPTRALVQIEPTASFPFAPPQVRILDAGVPLEPTFHANRDGSLCLWEDDWAVDDAPWRDPVELTARIAGWLRATAEGWPDDDSRDLERYLEPSAETMVLYDSATLKQGTAVRTIPGFKPNIVTITGDVRRIRDLTPKRRHRKDNRLAWIADIGAVTKPLSNWDDVATALGGRAAEVSRLISFGYVKFLLLAYTHGAASGALALEARSGREGIRVQAVESADTSPSTRGLRAGASAASLAEVRVAVVGVGAIGSFTADMLFRSGVRHLTLADGELLRPGNVVRHLAGLDQIGKSKGEAVRTCLERVDPDVSGVTVSHHLSDLEEATRLMRTYDVVVDATGSGRASSLLATAAESIGHQMGHVLISACVQRDGEVIRVDRMPLRSGESHLPALPPTDQDGGIREHGCGSPVSPTPPAAVISAAELATRFVLDEALGAQSLPATVADVRTPQMNPPFDRTGIIASGAARYRPPSEKP